MITWLKCISNKETSKSWMHDRSSRWHVFCKKDVVENFTEKHLCQSLSFYWRPGTLLKRDSRMWFSCEFGIIFKNTYLVESCEHLVLVRKIPFLREKISLLTTNAGTRRYCIYIKLPLKMSNFQTWLRLHQCASYRK